MIRIIFAFIVIVHGLIHLMGFIKAFKLAEINQLTQNISKPTGLLWLLSALLFITLLIVFLLNKDWWWIIATPVVILSLIPVVDAKGKEIDQGTMVRYLSEIVWFPSAALNNYVQWEQVDSTTAKATMTYGGITASGFYKFDENGDVVSFEAKRYYDRKGGATLEDWFIQIEPNGFKGYEGVRIPAKAAVTWKLKEGDFTWLNLEISEIHYNKIIN